MSVYTLKQLITDVDAVWKHYYNWMENNNERLVLCGLLIGYSFYFTGEFVVNKTISLVRNKSLEDKLED